MSELFFCNRQIKKTRDTRNRNMTTLTWSSELENFRYTLNLPKKDSASNRCDMDTEQVDMGYISLLGV